MTADGPRRIGRYVLLEPFASGGMATVHLGRQVGPAGIGRVVAIKRLHPHLAAEPGLATMFLDEARMAMRVHHPNVAPVVDVVLESRELLIVMDYVAGLPLARFVGKHGEPAEPVPPPVAAAILGDALQGLHAAHEATTETGQALELVHRDVSPQNLLVGSDGVTRVIDFGVAKAVGRSQVTRAADVKGKIAYMAPEQLSARPVSRRSDVYSAAVVLWECLTGRRLLAGEQEEAIEQVLLGDLDPPGRWVKGLPPALEDVVMRGLARDAADRWESARDMGLALEAALPRASAFEVGAWLERRAGPELAARAARARAGEAVAVDGGGAQTGGARLAAPALLLLGALGIAAGAWGLLRTKAADAPPAPFDGPDAPRASAAPPSVPGTAPAVASAPLPAASPSPPSPARRPPRSMPDCRVPYVIDDQGHKRYNRACLP